MEGGWVQGASRTIPLLTPATRPGPSLHSEVPGDRVISATLDITDTSLSSGPALKLNSDV